MFQLTSPFGPWSSSAGNVFSVYRETFLRDLAPTSDAPKVKPSSPGGIGPIGCAIPTTDRKGMLAMLSAARRRSDVVEIVMVMVYVIVTAYLVACTSPPRIASALRDALTPFQVIARARNAQQERTSAVWRASHREARTRYYYR
jgi:hypothetical protein